MNQKIVYSYKCAWSSHLNQKNNFQSIKSLAICKSIAFLYIVKILSYEKGIDKSLTMRNTIILGLNAIIFLADNILVTAVWIRDTVIAEKGSLGLQGITHRD